MTDHTTAKLPDSDERSGMTYLGDLGGLAGVEVSMCVRTITSIHV